MIPVGGDLGQPEVAAKVGKIQDVLLETGTAKANRALEELWSDARIGSDCPGNLIDVRAGSFAKSRDRIDAGDSLGKKGIRGKLGKLGRP